MPEQAMEQAQGPSVEAQAAKLLFGDLPGKPKQKAAQKEAPRTEANEPQAEQTEASEESNEGPDNTEEPLTTAEELFELELDGETYALPKKLEKAVMSTKDYTQKSQTVADRARQFEVLHEQARVANFRQAFEAENGQILSQIQAYDSVLKQPVDWNSMTTDEAFRKKLQLDTWKTERDELARNLSTVHQQWTQKQEQALAELRQKADEAVTKRIPSWSADKWNAIQEHAKSDGYTAAELKDIIDPRHKVTLWKAQQFDELKAKATRTVTDVKTVKTTSTNQMPQHVRDKLAFRKQIAKAAPGSPEHKRAVEARIGSIFGRGS
jgi:hypothetical protein